MLQSDLHFLKSEMLKKHVNKTFQIYLTPSCPTWAHLNLPSLPWLRPSRWARGCRGSQESPELHRTVRRPGRRGPGEETLQYCSSASGAPEEHITLYHCGDQLFDPKWRIFLLLTQKSWVFLLLLEVWLVKPTKTTSWLWHVFPEEIEGWYLTIFPSLIYMFKPIIDPIARINVQTSYFLCYNFKCFQALGIKAFGSGKKDRRGKILHMFFKWLTCFPSPVRPLKSFRTHNPGSSLELFLNKVVSLFILGLEPQKVTVSRGVSHLQSENLMLMVE